MGLLSFSPSGWVNASQAESLLDSEQWQAQRRYRIASTSKTTTLKESSISGEMPGSVTPCGWRAIPRGVAHKWRRYTR